MGIVQVAPRKRGTPSLTLRRGGIIYVNNAVVNNLNVPCRMRVEMDADTNGIWLRPDPDGRLLSRWHGKAGAYLQVRDAADSSPIPFDGRSYPAKACLDGSIVTVTERECVDCD